MAGAMPAPGALATAFLTGPIEVGPYSVRKMVASDWLALQKIESGIMLNAGELDKPESLRVNYWTDQTNYELIWILTHTPTQVRTALNLRQFPGSSGNLAQRAQELMIERFREMCAAETVDLMENPGDYKRLVEAVVEQITRANATILKHEAKNGDGDDGKTVFSQAVTQDNVTA